MDVQGRSSTPKERTVDDAMRLRILDELLARKTFVEVAELVGHHRTQVEMVANAHGWPQRDRMTWCRDLLVKRLAEPEQPIIVAAPKPVPKVAAKKAPTKQPVPKKEASRPQEPSAPVLPVPSLGAPVLAEVLAPTPVVSNPRPSVPGSLTDLIQRGVASKHASTQALAIIVGKATTALREALAAETPAPRKTPSPRPAAQSVEVAPEAFPAEPVKKKRKPSAGPNAWDRQSARLQPLGVSAGAVKDWGALHGYPYARGPLLVAGLLDAYEQAHT